MSILRIYSLRLLASLLLLPFFAAVILAILHEAIFPNTYFFDLPIVIGLWLVLFAGCHFFLSKMGKSRFHALDRLGWNFLQSNDTGLLSKVFANLERLFKGGLLSQKHRRELQKLVLRRYFSFYHENIASAKFRAGLIQCLALRIREEEAYDALKAFLIKQPALTLELVDLAEILHEFRPDDGAITLYMARQYLQDGQRHHRATYFYRKALEIESEQTLEIIDLCLKKSLSEKRRDAFAGWLYYRAWQNNYAGAFPWLAEQLYKTSQWYEATERNDELAHKLADVASGFAPEMVAEWRQAEQEKAQKQLPARLARARYHLHQKLLLLWDEIKIHRQYVYYAGAAISVVLIVYLAWPASQAIDDSQAAAINPVIDDSQARFTLQVAALKSQSRARNEVDRLKKAGLDAFIANPSGRSSYYRVRLGKFLTKNDALARGDSLRQKQAIRDFFVVNYSNRP
jgi:hypothetical protein